MTETETRKGGKRSFEETFEDIHAQLQKMAEGDQWARQEAELKDALEKAGSALDDLKKNNKAASQQEFSAIQQAAGSWFGALLLVPFVMAPLHLIGSGFRLHTERTARKRYDELRKSAARRLSGRYGSGAARFTSANHTLS